MCSPAGSVVRLARCGGIAPRHAPNREDQCAAMKWVLITEIWYKTPIVKFYAGRFGACYDVRLGAVFGAFFRSLSAAVRVVAASFVTIW